MNKMFKDNGFLSLEGQILLQPVKDALMYLLNSEFTKQMSVQELRVLQANLAKMVGDAMSDAIVACNKQDK